MSYPADMSTRTVVGTFLQPNGDTGTGTVTFTPSLRVTDRADAILMRAPAPVELNTDGYFAIELPCTDDRDLSPTDWYYTVRVRIRGARAFTYNLHLPVGDGSDVDVSSLGIPAS